jgi:hypothetical protein
MVCVAKHTAHALLPCLLLAKLVGQCIPVLCAGNANPFIWSAWGYLEYITSNVGRARKLFDAALVVEDTHAAAWHKWGVLEQKQGNYMRAR